MKVKSGFAACGLVLCAGAIASGQEVGEDFTRRDRTAILYSTKFQFTAEHIPIVTVLVMDDQDRVEFAADGPLVFQPEGEGGTAIRAGSGRTECRATLSDGRPAVVRWWVALARVPAADLERVRRTRAEWEAKGLSVRTFELGSIFGFYGRVLDNRVIVLVEDHPFDRAEEATARRDALARSLNVPTLEVFEEMVRAPKGVIRVQCRGVAADLSFPDVVFITTSGPDRILVKAVEFGRGFSWHAREDRSYRGQLVLAPDRRGRLAVINAVDAESLLQGLVPSEIYVDAPAEALKAQAVCARSELFAKLGTRHTADPYMTCSDVHCQVYRGASREDPRTNRAVAETRGRMLFGADAQSGQSALADAVYGASCGGHTEDGGLVWQGSSHPYLTGVVDGPDGVRAFPDDRRSEDVVRAFIEHPPQGLFCGSTRYGRDSFRWEKVVSADEVRRGVQEFTGVDVGEVSDLVPVQRGVSGRVVRLQVVGRAGRVELSPELTIRKALGGLKSSLFVADAQNRNGRLVFRIQGAGFGHGVGLCQVGAIGMAERGKTYEEILKHYYPGTELVRIY